jgi:hypothetical protein
VLFAERFARVLQAQIEDERLRGLGLFGGVNQISDSKDLGNQKKIGRVSVFQLIPCRLSYLLKSRLGGYFIFTCTTSYSVSGVGGVSKRALTA